MSNYLGASRGFILSRLALAASLMQTATRVPTPDILDQGRRLSETRYRPFRSARSGRPGRPRKRLAYPKCEPGTIAFHDMLVRRYGRRVADEIGRRYRAGDKHAIPRFE